MTVSVGIGVKVNVNVGEGVNISVGEMGITVSVKELLVDVWVAAAGCEAEVVGAPPVVETLHEIVVKRINGMKKYRLLFIILLLYYRLVFQFLNVCTKSGIASQRPAGNHAIPSKNPTNRWGPDLSFSFFSPLLIFFLITEGF